MSLDDDEADTDVTEWISTGFPNIDKVLGGGLPIGRASEVSGPESCGKTAFACYLCYMIQKMGGIVIYLDYERSVEKRVLVRMGADPKKIIFPDLDYAEQGWHMVWNALEKAQVDAKEGKVKVPPILIVWDSVAGTESKAEFEADATADPRVASLASVMSRNCKRLFREIKRARAHMLFINQQRDKFGGRSFQKESDTPGGRAVKYAVSLRLFFNAWAVPLKKKPKTGLMVKVFTKKSRLTPPFRDTTWVLDFGVGPSPELTAFALLLEHRVIKTVSAKERTYSCPWMKQFHRDDWLTHMQDPEFRQKAFDALLDTVGKNPADTDEDDDD